MNDIVFSPSELRLASAGGDALIKVQIISIYSIIYLRRFVLIHGICVHGMKDMGSP